MKLLYAGVGSRRTPPETLALMTRLAICLRALGWTLRSGGAVGADRAFEVGAGRQKEIFGAGDASPEALLLAAEVHPAWARCDEYARRLHGRNCHQVLGADLCAPVKFVCCWTPDGAEAEADCSIVTGGTATAIRVAGRYGIPVFNLQRPGRLELLKPLIERYRDVRPEAEGGPPGRGAAGDPARAGAPEQRLPGEPA